MITLELPVVFTTNHEEVEEREQQGIPVERIEDIDKCFFIIPDTIVVGCNPNSSVNRTTLTLDGEGSFTVDMDYETVVLALREALKKRP